MVYFFYVSADFQFRANDYRWFDFKYKLLLLVWPIIRNTLAKVGDLTDNNAKTMVEI